MEIHIQKLGALRREGVSGSIKQVKFIYKISSSWFQRFLWNDKIFVDSEIMDNPIFWAHDFSTVFQGSFLAFFKHL